MAGAVQKKRGPLRGKGGLVAVGVVAALGIWYAVDLQRPVTDPNAPKAFETVGAQSKDVTRVELKRPSGTLVLAKVGDGWNFEQPGRYAANPESVKSWLKGLLDDTDSRPITDQSPDLAKYGLDKPQMELALKTGSGTRTLQIGKEFKLPSQPKGERYYAREAGSGRLFLLPSGEVEGLRDKKIDDLRDKRLMVLGEESEVRSITLQRPGQKLEVTREGTDKWKMSAPFTAAASADDVSTLLSRLKTAEAESFAEDGAKDPAKYGLDQPRLTAQVVTSKGSQGVTFGKTLKDGKVYAAREGSTAVMVVSKFGFEDITGQGTVGKLRDRKLSTLDRDKISTVELRNKHGVVRLRKAAQDTWVFADEKDPKKNKANGERVRQVLDRVTGEATAHVEEAPKDPAQYGLDKPLITVTYGDGRSAGQTFLLGKKLKDGYYAKGAANAVFVVSNFIFDDLNLKQEAFQSEAK